MAGGNVLVSIQRMPNLKFSQLRSCLCYEDKKDCVTPNGSCKRCSSALTVVFPPPLSVWLLPALFPVFTFFFTPQAEGLSTFHHWSNHMKTFLSFLPIIRSQLVAIFTPVQVFNPLSWNFDFWFDLWTGAAAASLTQPLLDSAQLTIRFLFWGNIITVCCHWIPILFFSAVVNSIWQVIGFVPATWW